MRISDWSSDVCSSDLDRRNGTARLRKHARVQFAFDAQVRPREKHVLAERAARARLAVGAMTSVGSKTKPLLQDITHRSANAPARQLAFHRLPLLPPAHSNRNGRRLRPPTDRKSVVSGKRGSVRVDIGGSGISKKK